MRVELRLVSTDDQNLLYQLFCSASEAEFSLLGDAQRQPLLAMQFRAQGMGYDAQFPGSQQFIIVVDGSDAGQLWVHQSDNEYRVVDVAILPEFRNQGVGSWVLRKCAEQAGAAGLPMRARVAKTNAGSLRLQLRLGFGIKAEEATHWEIEWGWRSKDHSTGGG